MSSAERLPFPEESRDEAEVVELSFRGPEAQSEEDMVQTSMLFMLSEEGRSTVMRLANRYGAQPMDILNASVGAYEIWTDLIDAGSRLHYIDQLGQSHPINDSDAIPPQAA